MEKVITAGIRYTGINLPEGASVDENTGAVRWNPQQKGEYTFYISAQAGENTVLKRIHIIVSATRDEAVANAVKTYDENEIYISDGLKVFQKVWKIPVSPIRTLRRS